MRGGKDEEKLSCPMFPRLHVNDTEKGGPRAPPRNKMALYEQLSIPTQRFSSSGSASVTPVPSGSLVPSRSSSHIVGQKRDAFSLFSKSSAQSHQVDKLRPNASNRIQNNTTSSNEKTSVKTLSSSSPQCNSFGKNKFANMKKFPSKSIRQKDDFSVSASDQEITEQTKNDVHNYDRERMSSSPISSAQCRIACESEPQTYIAVRDMKSRKYVGNEAEENPKLTKAIRDPVERPTFFPSARDEAVVEPNACPSTKFRDSEKAMQHHSSLAKEKLYGANVRTYQECQAEQNNEALKEKVGCTQVPGLEKTSTVLRESCSVLSRERNFENLDNCSRLSESKKCSTVHLRDADRHDNASNASMVDSVSALNISPDVVVGAIGEKQFWKARKAIVHQQRIFAVQVFELHRLLKVQRLIAESPHMLLEDYLDKPPPVSAVKNKPSAYAQPQFPSATPKDSYQRLNLYHECADKNQLGKLPLPSFNKASSKLLSTQQTDYELYLKNISKTPVATATKAESCCLNPIPGNQWMIPMMSPSEGLIYKPYTGPCPPNAGFPAPIYGNYGSAGLNTGRGDFYTAAYAVPTSHHQGAGFFPGAIPLNPTYFPSFSLPVTNQSMSGSATDQMSLFVRVKSNGQENVSSTGDVNYSAQMQNLCDMSSQVSHAMPLRVRKIHGSKGSELQQGSTASSPSARGNRDMLPLFPTEPTAEESNQNAESSELKSRAIKVVPHNPTSATESVARIFQLIQEERKQL